MSDYYDNWVDHQLAHGRSPYAEPIVPIPEFYSDIEWVHHTDGTPCSSGPAVEGDTHCLDHDRVIRRAK